MIVEFEIHSKQLYPRTGSAITTVRVHNLDQYFKIREMIETELNVERIVITKILLERRA